MVRGIYSTLLSKCSGDIYSIEIDKKSSSVDSIQTKYSTLWLENSTLLFFPHALEKSILERLTKSRVVSTLHKQNRFLSCQNHTQRIQSRPGVYTGLVAGGDTFIVKSL